MLGLITTARFFLLITRNIENALSTFALDMAKVTRSNTQQERMDQSGTCILQKHRGSTISFRVYAWYSRNSAPNCWCHVVARREQASARKSRQFCFHVRVDLRTIPKWIAHILQVVYIISLKSATPLIGYSSVMLPKYTNSVTAFLLNNYVEQAVNFSTITCHWCIAPLIEQERELDKQVIQRARNHHAIFQPG